MATSSSSRAAGGPPRASGKRAAGGPAALEAPETGAEGAPAPPQPPVSAPARYLSTPKVPKHRQRPPGRAESAQGSRRPRGPRPGPRRPPGAAVAELEAPSSGSGGSRATPAGAGRLLCMLWIFMQDGHFPIGGRFFKPAGQRIAGPRPAAGPGSRRRAELAHGHARKRITAGGRGRCGPSAGSAGAGFVAAGVGEGRWRGTWPTAPPQRPPQPS